MYCHNVRWVHCSPVAAQVTQLVSEDKDDFMFHGEKKLDDVRNTKRIRSQSESKDGK